MNLDGSNQTNLTNILCLNMHPAWSPDASRIAFVSNRRLCSGSQLDLWLMRRDRRALVKVTDIAESPTWERDDRLRPDRRPAGFQAIFAMSGRLDRPSACGAGSRTERLTAPGSPTRVWTLATATGTLRSTR
jgi:hypothetical protein